MPSDDDLIRFHNGDTLDNIPVVRPRPAQDPPAFTTRGVVLTIVVAALVTGSAVGWALSTGGPQEPPAVSTHAAETITSPPQSVSATPAPTVTVWQAPSVVTATPEVPVSDIAAVQVVQAPEVGGDPSTDYCLSYTGSFTGDVPDAILLAEAPAYQCDDLVFSTHPSDGAGVWESSPPDCSETPGARTAFVTFSATSVWYGADAYTCLLPSDGA